MTRFALHPVLTAALLLGTVHALCADDAAEAPAVTAAEYLATLPKPQFAPGHTLLPLTRFGWTLPLEARIAFTEDWGYALEMGGYVSQKTVEKMHKPGTDEAKLVALAAADPQRYPLAVICNRDLPTKEAPPEAWTRDADGHYLNAKAQSLDGTEWNAGMKTVWSPEAPDSVWQEAGRRRAEPIAAIREKAPIAIVLNGGEYGLGVAGFAQKVWEKDPAVMAAKGERSWFAYISERKAHTETLIADAVKAVTPDRRAYIYYPTSGGTHRAHTADWGDWSYGYEWMKPVSDLASSEHYYMHFNSGWTGKDDMLTQALNARGFEIAAGSPLCYEWLCAGWTRETQLVTNKPLADKGMGDLERYMGFLKCMYAAGMVGGNAGYYTYPDGGFGATFAPDAPPHWLLQMVVLGRAQALFSHLESYIRDGDLLPGPQPHAWNRTHPAYEFPTGDPEVRVLARQKRDAADFLIVAWAAGGEARDVTVDIPGIGQMLLTARPAGSVYTRHGADAQLVDTDPMLPTQGFKKP